MEGMLKEMCRDYFVDFKLNEIRDVVIATETLLGRYVAVLNKRSRYFKVLDIEMAGSMAEKTRIWSFDSATFQRVGNENSKRFPVIEFDFVARLDIDEDLDRQTFKSCIGHRNIYKMSQKGKRFSFHRSKGVFLSPVDVRQRFQNELLTAIESTCSCNAIVELHHGIDCIGRKKTGCKKCKVKSKSGSLMIASMTEFGNSFEKRCDLIFKWRSISCSLLAKDIEVQSVDEFSAVEICVLVDFLPSYGLHESEYQLSEVGSRSLIPKVCNACEQKICWRISNSREETKLIQGTSENHRSVFMALKVFVVLTFQRSDEIHTPISSYIVKTAFLYHIFNCKKNGTTVDCFLSILDLISVSFQKRNLSNIFTGHNLLEKYTHLDETFFQEYSTCFEIIKHVVLLADLLGDKNCCINVIYPYLRNANIMYESLRQKKESLGNLQKYISKIQAEHVTVADAVDLMQEDVSKHARRGYVLNEGNSSYDEYSRPVDTVSINSRPVSGESTRSYADTRGIINEQKFDKQCSKYGQNSKVNQDDKKPPGKKGSFISRPLRWANSIKQFMGRDLQNRNKSRPRDMAVVIEGKTPDLRRKDMYRHRKIDQAQTGIQNHMKKVHVKRNKRPKKAEEDTVASYLLSKLR